MGQKVNAHGLRVGVIKNWDSRWYAKSDVFGDTLVNDYKIRNYLKNRLVNAGIPKIEIERDNTGKMRVYIHCAKPGMIIGRDGAEIEKLRADVEKMAGVPVSVNVIAVKPVEMSAQLVAENIASQLERRIGFRRAMKQAIGRTMRMGAKGIKVTVSGRLGGAEIARSFWSSRRSGASACCAMAASISSFVNIVKILMYFSASESETLSQN